MKAYIATPIFSPLERMFAEEMASIVSDYAEPYLPHKHGPLVESSLRAGEGREVLRVAYESDLAAIRACDIVVAVLEGRALDEGVCVEIGYARALGKRIVGYKSDVRVVLPWGNNPMIDGCVDYWAATLDELQEKIRICHLDQNAPAPGELRVHSQS